VYVHVAIHLVSSVSHEVQMFEHLSLFLTLTVYPQRITAMGVKETDIQEERSRVVLRSLQKLTSQFLHVSNVASTLQKITVRLSVRKVKWINLDQEELEQNGQQVPPATGVN